MPCRSVSLDVPAATAWSADVCRLDAIGSSVIRRLLPRAVEHLGGERLAAELLDPVFDRVLASSGFAAIHSDVAYSRLEQLLDGAGVLGQELRGDDQVRGDEVAVGPQLLLVDQHVRAGVDHEARRPRLRQPGAVELAGLEQVERLRVLLRRDGHVARRRRASLQALARRARRAARRPGCCPAAGWRAWCRRGPRGSRCPRGRRAARRRRSRRRRCGPPRRSTARTR